ncbi:MAG: hypothetical protein ACLRPT_10670 [Akkermansia muciniphila]
MAQSLGMNGTVRKREDDRDSFAAEGSYFSSGRMQGGEEDSMPLELGGISRSRDVLAEGARFIWRIAPFATERTEADAEAWPLMTPIRK